MEQNPQSPYIVKRRVQIVTEYLYNPAYGDQKLCECGHKYVKHFDPYEDWHAVGCKFCVCDHFKPIKLECS